MRLIRCPDEMTGTRSERGPAVFLAGGITGCPDWQADMVEYLQACVDFPDDRGPIPEFVVINPRREDFDVDDPDMGHAQVEWEFRHLEAADLVSFWFPSDTLCPITLYELGVYAATREHVVVGCDDDYARRFDVVKQLSLRRPSVRVVQSPIHVAHGIIDWLYVDQEVRRWGGDGYW